MALNAGFQYLEQRDQTDSIVKSGVVSKKQPFANSTNTGIYDVIAEDLRVLYDDFSSTAMQKIKTDVTAMYTDMQNNPNYGSTAATAQAQLALQYAQQAKGYLDTIEDDLDDLDRIDSFLTTMTGYVAQLQTAMSTLDDNIATAQGLVNTAKTTAQSVSADKLMAQKWAEASDSPNGASDTDSKTGKTQSAKTWATDSKNFALQAKGYRDALTKAITYEGSVNAYADLPTTNLHIGMMYNIATADKTHQIVAGDNVVWNGTAWDNFGGYVSLDGYTQDKDLATVAKSGKYSDLSGKPSIIQGTVSTDFPTSPTAGEMCYRTDKNKLFQYNGSKWESSFGGGLSVWQSGGEYEVDNCVIHNTYIFRCTTKHAATDTFDYSKWTHIGGYAGNFFKWNPVTETVEMKSKDEITLTDMVTDEDSVKGFVESYCKIYSGSLWKYNTDGQLVPKTSTEITTADGNISREKLREIAAEVGVPIGTVLPFMGNGDLQEGYLLCNGASVGRTTYPQLFEVIGTTYGAEDDDHFNLPNLVDKFIEGAESAGGEIEAGLPNITGTTVTGAYSNLSETTISPSGAFATGGVATVKLNGGSNNSLYTYGGTFDASRSSSIYGNSTTVQPPSLTVRYGIKAFHGQTTNTGLVDVTSLANSKAGTDLDNLSSKGKDSFLERDFCIIYPNGGTESSPANVTNNSRYIMDNPFPGYHVYCAAEVRYNGQWGETGWYSDYRSDPRAIGTKASQVGDNIILQTGQDAIMVNVSSRSGTGLYLNDASAVVGNLPCRVKVWKIGKVE